MTERLLLDDAQYALLRSLRDCRGPTGRAPKRRLLQHARETYGLTAERAMRALSDLHREKLVRLDLAQRVFLASGVTLLEAGDPGAPHSMRGDDGMVWLVLPAPSPADAPAEI
jgi:hypothetical protein